MIKEYDGDADALLMGDGNTGVQMVLFVQLV